MMLSTATEIKKMYHPYFSFIDHPDLTKAEKVILGSWIIKMSQAYDLLTEMKENGVIIQVKEGDSHAYVTFKPGYKFKWEIYGKMVQAQKDIDDY